MVKKGGKKLEPIKATQRQREIIHDALQDRRSDVEKMAEKAPTERIKKAFLEYSAEIDEIMAPMLPFQPDDNQGKLEVK